MVNNIRQRVIDMYNWCMQYKVVGCSGKLQLNQNDFNHMKTELTDFAYYFEHTNPVFKEELARIVNGLGKRMGINVVIVPIAFTQLLVVIRMLHHEVTSVKFDWWEYMHPRITELCRKKFDDEHYGDSVKTACIEVCLIIKNFRREHGHPLIHSETDMIRATIKKGDSLLTFNDQESTTEKNIQEGYAKIFDGVIQGIRNEGAHDHANMTAGEAARKLMLISDLISMLDVAFDRNNLLS